MRFLVDMPLSPALADWLQKKGHDAVHAFRIGLGKASDEEIMRRARNEGRVIVTADLDYPRLLSRSLSKRSPMGMWRWLGGF